MLKKRNGLSLLCLALILCSCASAPAQVKTVKILIPVELTLERYPPVWSGTTNADLFDYTMDLIDVIDKHNIDKRSIQEFNQ